MFAGFCNTSVKSQFLVAVSSGHALSLFWRSWWEVAWLGYFVFPFSSPISSLFSLPLLLHWELPFLHQSLPSPYPHTHICTENLRHFKQTCFNVIMPCYTLKNFSFQSEHRYSAGLPCSVTVQIKLGFILKLLLQSVHNQRLLFE